jgi:murein biosynthesis integral membrane protein MurJ
LKKDDRESGFLFASRFINIIFILISAVTILGMIFSRQLIGLFLPGSSAEVQLLAMRLLRIMFPAAVMAGIAFSFVSILQSMGQFTVPAMISLFPNVLMIAYILLLNKNFGVEGLAVAFLLAWLLQVLVQIPFVKRKNFIYTPSIRFRDPGIKKVSKMVLPILISSWVAPVSLFILGALASYMGEGAVTSVRLSNRLYMILAGIFVFAMMNYLFPLMSRQAGDENPDEFNNTYRRAFESLCFFILPLSVGAFILSPNLIALLYERGEFTSAATQMMSAAFAGFCPAVFGYSLYEITSKAYYARKKVTAPTIMSIITLALTFVLAYIVVFNTDLGVGYVSLAFSIGILLSAIILAAAFNKSMGGILRGRSISELLRGITGAVGMGIVVIVFKRLVIDKASGGFWPMLLLTLAAAVIGIGVYIGIMAILKSPTFGYYYRWAKERFAGRN